LPRAYKGTKKVAWRIQNSSQKRTGSSSGDPVEGDREERARKELDWDKKISCVISSYSEIVINPLPGYD
jgi:hypothetical protein